MNYVEAWAELHEESYQRFQEVPDYQADSWSRPRRIVAKCEVTGQGGPNQRFVVTNLIDRPEQVYRGVYVKRGDAPERAIEELKHGLGIDRLSSHRFFANAFTLQCHLLAYALFILFREANAAVPEISRHTLETVRARVLKIGAVVKTTARKVWFHASASWPGRDLFQRVCDAVNTFAHQLGRLWPDRIAEGVSTKLGGPVNITK